MKWLSRRRNLPVSDGGPSMRDAGAQFRAAWLAQEPALLDAELLPARLARAAVQVLQVDGAGISVLDDEFRVPLGSSDDQAGIAERLQFTVGEGPCLDAARAHRSATASAAQIDDRWPAFGAQLFERTPYRAVMALPIGNADERFGALDLYLIDPNRLGDISASAAIAVTQEIMAALTASDASAVSSLTGFEGPRWLHGAQPNTRLSVWIAIGELMAAFDLPDPEALALLRARAFSSDSTVDEVAAQLNGGDLHADDFAP